MSNNLTTEDKILKAKIALHASHPFFSYILINMDIREAKEGELPCPTMGVDRYGNLIYDAGFVEGLNADQIKAVLCHEAMHVATLTFRRQAYRDMMIWNIATDYIINWYLVNEQFELPKGCCVPDSKGIISIKKKDGRTAEVDASEMTAEDLYDALESHAEKIDISGMWGDGGSGMGSKQFDNHLKGKDENGNENGNEESTSGKSEADNRWKAKCAEAAIAAKTRGKLSIRFERAVCDVMEPKVDWRKKLWNFITRDIPINFSMKRPGRRFYGTGIYCGVPIKESLDIEIGIDVSGSISENELTQFASEVIGIANGFAQVNAHVFFWSTAITDSDELILHRGSMASDFLKHKFNSTGGTTMSCIPDYFKRKGKRPQICVILTDGYIETSPKVPECKLLFVLSKNSIDTIVKQYGEVCKLSDNESE